MSACWVRVGMPVDGLPRWMSKMTAGISAKYARPMNSCISEMPGPEVAVKARAPFQRGADHHADRGQLVLGLDDRVALLLAVGVAAQPLAMRREGLGERGGRRDRVPGAHRGAAVDRAQGRGVVAADEDAVADLVALFEPEAERAIERLGAPIRGRAASACRFGLISVSLPRNCSPISFSIAGTSMSSSADSTPR